MNSTRLVYYDLFSPTEYYLFYQTNRLNGLARARCLDLVAECRRRPSLYCSPSARISFGAQLSDLFYLFFQLLQRKHNKKKELIRLSWIRKTKTEKHQQYYDVSIHHGLYSVAIKLTGVGGSWST